MLASTGSCPAAPIRFSRNTSRAVDGASSSSRSSGGSLISGSEAGRRSGYGPGFITAAARRRIPEPPLRDGQGDEGHRVGPFVSVEHVAYPQQVPGPETGRREHLGRRRHDLGQAAGARIAAASRRTVPST
jgi:hypothetical protein